MTEEKDDWADWDGYLHPVLEMFADPVKYAAYRARVEAAMKHPAEVKRAADMRLYFTKLCDPNSFDPPAS